MDKDEKAKLYNLIVKRTSEHTLLERMRLYGFWPQAEDLPADPPDEAQERARLVQALGELSRTQGQAVDPERALAEERKRRWAESKQRRAEARAQREAGLEARRQAYAAYRADRIVHAGEGVSAGLQAGESDVARLEAHGLPVLRDAGELAKALGVTLSTLRWLTYHRRGATLVHYHRFEIPKKTGGQRLISAPKPALAGAQRWVLANLLEKLEPDAAAHGFVARHSIVSNAAPHTGRQVVLNVDLKDFFPSISFRRVKGLFHKLGYSEHLSTVLGLLCTEPPRVPFEHEGKVYFVALGERRLPQGACTSPAITNAICRRLDRRLAGIARRHGFAYTRYADDLTFSGDLAQAAGRLLRSVRGILQGEGLTENAAKTRVMRRSRRQEVTGLTVNQSATLPRAARRALRALLHNVARDGLAAQNRGAHPNFAAHLRGLVAFACMVDPRRAEVWREELRRALARS